MFRLLSNRWLQTALLLALLGGSVHLSNANIKWVSELRNIAFDSYNRFSPRAAGNTVVIIDIDEESLHHIGQWPWPRHMIAELVKNLNDMGAKSITFDMVFAESDRTSPKSFLESLPEKTKNLENALTQLPDNDETLGQQIADAGNVVTGFVAATKRRIVQHTPDLKAKIVTKNITHPENHILSFANFATNLPVIEKNAAGNGSFTLLPDQDGLIRRVPLLIGYKTDKSANTEIYPALALETLRVAEDNKKIFVHGTQNGIRQIRIGNHTIPTDTEGNLWLQFSGHRRGLYIPAWKILTQTIDADRIKDKIVLVGTSSIGLLDIRSTPLDLFIPGVEVHAEIIDQVLSEHYLSRPDYIDGAEIWTIIALGLAIIILAPFLGAINLAFVGSTLIFAGFWGSWYAYNVHGLLLDPVYPALSVVAIYFATSILTNLRSETEKRAVRHAFGHYISPAFMNELTKNPESLKLGGETRELTIMFTDIRGFTSVSENLEPDELIGLINDFLTPMSAQVLDNRGTIDKYIGDAMMAFWNAPLPDENHAQDACRAALGMAAALGPVNENMQKLCAAKNRPFVPLRAGIGVNTGACAVGNMGSKQRFAYSAIGDAVNLAARLEGQTKTYGVPVLISDNTYQQAPEFAVLELDLIQVKGRSAPVKIYALIGDEDCAALDSFKDFSSAHQEMISRYLALEFDQAQAMLARCRERSRGFGDFDMLYDLYDARITALLNSPPDAAQWNGIYVAETK